MGFPPARAGGPYNITLKRQGITFEVQSRGEGSQQQLSIATQGSQRPIKTFRQTMDGRVVGAEVADLNGNGLPEVYVFVQGRAPEAEVMARWWPMP